MGDVAVEVYGSGRHGRRCRVSEARRAFHQRRERPEASEVRARGGGEQVQSVRRQWYLPAPEEQVHVQRVWRQ